MVLRRVPVFAQLGELFLEVIVAFGRRGSVLLFLSLLRKLLSIQLLLLLSPECKFFLVFLLEDGLSRLVVAAWGVEDVEKRFSFRVKSQHTLAVVVSVNMVWRLSQHFLFILLSGRADFPLGRVQLGFGVERQPLILVITL